MSEIATILADLTAEPWAIVPRGLERLMAFSPSALSAPAQPMPKSDGIAAIQLRGPIFRGRARKVLQAYGFAHAGMDDIADEIAAAVDDPAVRSIRLDVDSPGGSAVGLKALAQAIHDADARKPVTAHVYGMAASAAYYLASQARTITAEPDALVGSIGVFSAIADTSGMLEQMGVKVHVIRSGQHKGAGIDGVTPENLKMFQGVIDDMASGFVDAVARGRKMPRERAEQLADGSEWTAERAVALGLIDSVRSTLSNQPVRPAQTGGSRMSGPNEEQPGSAPAADVKPAAPKAQEPERAPDVAPQVSADARALELRAVKQRLEAVCPRGLEGSLDAYMLGDNPTFEGGRRALLEANTARLKPVGTPEPAEPAKPEAAKTITIETLAAGLFPTLELAEAK